MDDVVRQRRSDLLVSKLLALGHADGRLLVYYPDADLSDGAAEDASGHFFDVYNAPPWATWVGYFDDRSVFESYASYLVAWIPAAMVKRAQAGIDVNPEQCIEWLSDSKVLARSIFEDLKLGEFLPHRVSD